jgi:hypothetical protein
LGLKANVSRSVEENKGIGNHTRHHSPSKVRFGIQITTWRSMPCHLIVFIIMYAFNDVDLAVLHVSKSDVRAKPLRMQCVRTNGQLFPTVQKAGQTAGE